MHSVSKDIVRVVRCWFVFVVRCLTSPLKRRKWKVLQRWTKAGATSYQWSKWVRSGKHDVFSLYLDKRRYIWVQVRVNTNTVSTLVLMLQVDGERVPRDAGHPHYPFNDPYWPSTLHPESVPSTAPPTPHSPPISLINVPGSWHRSLSLDSVKSCTYH